MMLDPLQRPHYDIITAMRGPDGDSPDHIKTLTTAVIRWFVFDGGSAGGWCDVMSPQSAKSYWLFDPASEYAAEAADELLILRQWWNNNDHFSNHIANAFRALGRTNDEAAAYWRWLLSVLEP